jgi:hypothetical protein
LRPKSRDGKSHSGNLTVSGLYDANIVSISGSAISAKNLALFFNASGYAASGSVNKLNGRLEHLLDKQVTKLIIAKPHLNNSKIAQ